MGAHRVRDERQRCRSQPRTTHRGNRVPRRRPGRPPRADRPHLASGRPDRRLPAGRRRRGTLPRPVPSRRRCRAGDREPAGAAAQGHGHPRRHRRDARPRVDGCDPLRRGGRRCTLCPAGRGGGRQRGCRQAGRSHAGRAVRPAARIPRGRHHDRDGGIRRACARLRQAPHRARRGRLVAAVRARERAGAGTIQLLEPGASGGSCRRPRADRSPADRRRSTASRTRWVWARLRAGTLRPRCHVGSTGRLLCRRDRCLRRAGVGPRPAP